MNVFRPPQLQFVTPETPVTARQAVGEAAVDAVQQEVERSDRAKASARAVEALRNRAEPEFDANEDTAESESIVSSEGRSNRATTEVPDEPLLHPRTHLSLEAKTYCFVLCNRYCSQYKPGQITDFWSKTIEPQLNDWLSERSQPTCTDTGRFVGRVFDWLIDTIKRQEKETGTVQQDSDYIQQATKFLFYAADKNPSVRKKLEVARLVFSNSQQAAAMHNQLSVTLGQKRRHGEIASRANTASSAEPAPSTEVVDEGEPLPKLTRRSAQRLMTKERVAKIFIRGVRESLEQHGNVMADAIKEAFGRRLPLEPSNQVSAAPSAPSTAEVKALAEKVRRVEDDFVKQNSPAAAQAMLQMQAAILALSNKMELFLNGAMVDGQSIVVNALAKHRESVSKAQIYARIADNVVEEEQAIRAANGLSPHLTEEVIRQLAEKLKKAAV